VALIRAAGDEAVSIPTDVSREQDCARLVGETVRRHGRLDALVNVAGIYPRAALAETSLALWREILAVNLDGPFVLCREAVPHLIAAGGGSIVNVGSFHGLGGTADLVAYSVSKAGLLGLTRNLAAAFCQQGVRANYLIPGWVLTETELEIRAAEGHDEAWLRAQTDRLPAGRFSTPEDAAFATLYLVSDESALLNGAILNLDGGTAMLPAAARNIAAQLDA
jgi:NAD(P)-dependent dehydrogenase (short-subunit alcohol dehydrogenase family)